MTKPNAMPNARLLISPHRLLCSQTQMAVAGMLLLLALILCAGLWANPVLAAPTAGDDKPQATQVNVSASQAARAARREYGGKVLSVILDAETKAPYYQVKLLSAGQVRVVRVTATDRAQK